MGYLEKKGLAQVQQELQRMRKAQAPAITQAVKSAAEYGEKLAIDAIFNQYGFKSRSYVEQNFGLSFNPKSFEGRIFARYRPSTLTRFNHSKAQQISRKRNSGYKIAVTRNKPVLFRGAFTVLGRNGNQLIFSRKKGDNSWRSLRGQKSLYGPSVSASFGYLREEIEPKIIRHLRDKYRKGLG
ncbi:hypothetical protein D5018_03950 [Parashewanella curva]|uniref:Uncharacterized protein n=1 Tax=Parashewanella curva TaxID=2338552 RepID=A0A3L8Q2G7_9GAMM|nr:hypothetical protein [Parashewanella curva]RLV61003.1 hypothetical protein D5018_03950 [Parashewanella curva]